MAPMLLPEPLLDPNSERFTMFPIKCACAARAPARAPFRRRPRLLRARR